jgi:antitoxin component of RelBE/YafQ-DinJ toxin-antitoxin module
MKMTVAQLAVKEDLCRRIMDLPIETVEHLARYLDDLKEHEPNEETIAAMEEADRISRDPCARTYTSVKDLFAELRSECMR